MEAVVVVVAGSCCCCCWKLLLLLEVFVAVGSCCCCWKFHSSRRHWCIAVEQGRMNSWPLMWNHLLLTHLVPERTGQPACLVL